MAKTPKHTVGVKITTPGSISAIGWTRISEVIDAHPNVAVRLAGLSPEDGRTVVTFAISLGTAREIAAPSERALEATRMVATLINDFADMDAAFCVLPEEDSYEAELADQYVALQQSTQGEFIPA